MLCAAEAREISDGFSWTLRRPWHGTDSEASGTNLLECLVLAAPELCHQPCPWTPSPLGAGGPRVDLSGRVIRCLRISGEAGSSNRTSGGRQRPWEHARPRASTREPPEPPFSSPACGPDLPHETLIDVPLTASRNSLQRTGAVAPIAQPVTVTVTSHCAQHDKLCLPTPEPRRSP